MGSMNGLFSAYSRERQECYDEYEFNLVHFRQSFFFLMGKAAHQIPDIHSDGE